MRIKKQQAPQPSLTLPTIDTPQMIYEGNCLHVMKQIPSNSIGGCVTDPPYGIGTREPTAEELIAYLRGSEMDTGGDFCGMSWNVPSIAIWKELFRILKPGAHACIFTAPRTTYLLNLGLRAAGFETRDLFQWLQGNGYPKSLNIEKALTSLNYAIANEWKGYGTQLKPTNEPIILVRKPFSEENTVANVIKHNVGAINIDACRVETDWSERPDSWKRSGIARSNESKIAAPPSNGIECNELGRFPPNTLFTHMEECTDDRCVQGCPIAELNSQVQPRVQNKSTPPKKLKGYPIAVHTSSYTLTLKPHMMRTREAEITPSMFFPSFRYVSKSSAKERDLGCEHMRWRYNPKAENNFEPITQEEFDLLPTDQRTMGNPHPTVKPIEILKWLLKLIHTPREIIIDPFVGSGSTLVAASHLRIKLIAIEMNPIFVNVAKSRLAHAKRNPPRTEDRSSVSKTSRF